MRDFGKMTSLAVLLPVLSNPSVLEVFAVVYWAELAEAVVIAVPLV